MASPTQWTWVWASSSGRWWRMGQPGVLQSMGSQRVRHDWEIEQWWICDAYRIFWFDYWTFVFLPTWEASLVMLVVKNSPARAGDTRDVGPVSGWGRTPLRGNDEQKSLSGYSPWGHKESDTTEWLTKSNFLLPEHSFSKHSYTYLLW